jgi:serine-type D-Ala-D-Ala carboxypeptidase (penicillin-binding protein 5/6)
MRAQAGPARSRALRRGGGLLALTLLVTGLFGASLPPAHADGTPPPEAFILVDAKTGAIITGRHVHEALSPASTAKIMTALVAVERLPPDARIHVSSDAAGREAMKIGMPAGSRWPFKDAMASMMMVSANDAAYAIAESAAGSISGFANDANETARRYGMRDSTFGDPAGLTDETSYKGGPKTSAYDLAIATRNALTVPAIAHWADTTDYEFTDPSGLHHTLHNHDKFLPNNGFGYVGANGFKTGYTELAQHSLVATANRGGRECIAVILGAVDGGYTWAASLLDQCWVKPRVATTGKFLPPIAVSPYASRTAARAGFARVALGKKAAQHEVSAAPATTTPSAAGDAHPSTPAAPAGNAAAAGHNTNNTSNTGGTAAAANAAREINTTPAVATTLGSSGGGGLLTSTPFILLVIAFLVVAFVLRRRAVRNQRARRLARQRARAKAMRSGSLPVVDGKYRTGTRVGPPEDSRVRVARSHIDIPAEERRRSRSRNS